MLFVPFFASVVLLLLLLVAERKYGSRRSSFGSGGRAARRNTIESFAFVEDGGGSEVSLVRDAITRRSISVDHSVTQKHIASIGTSPPPQDISTQVGNFYWSANIFSGVVLLGISDSVV